MKYIRNLVNFLVNNKTAFRDFVAVILLRLNLIPEKFRGRTQAIYKAQKYKKKFLELKLEHDEMGFHYLDPMPTKDFLKKYYTETYWQNRTDKNYPIRLRDVEHYKLLKKIYPDFDNGSKKILNFGAGHGGLSILLYTAKHEIYNFDPGGINSLFSDRWNAINNLNEISNKFDLIYGSHSLEHVQNIKETMKKFNKISHQNTIYFFEVPNCTSNVLKIHPPHTYYFSRKFFYNYFHKSDYCETFSGLDEAKNDEGNIIRFLSKSKIKENLLK